MSQRKTLVVIATVAALLAAGCGGPAASQGPSGSPTPSVTPSGLEPSQLNESGAVTVEAMWEGPAAGAVFDVTLDTHSVDLDALDLSDAVLMNSRGETLAAIPWEAPTGGHHRQGRLTFSGNTAAFFADTSWIELTIKDVGGIAARVLRWQLRP